MLKKALNETLVFWVAAIIVFVDQYVKYLVRANLTLGQSWNPWAWLAPHARIVHVQNTGAAFGMFKEAWLVFAIIAVLVSAFIIYYTLRLPEGLWRTRAVMGLLLAGALGNLIDRLLFSGAVTDMFSVTIPFINYDFAVFNVADSSISVGVVLLMLLMWGEGRTEFKPAAPVPPPPAETDEAPAPEASESPVA